MVEIIDFRDPKEFEYEYLRHRDTPIRIVFNKDGYEVSQDTLDIENKKLVRGFFRMSTINDPFTDEISKDEFDALCQELVSKKKT
ncbi:MAG: hypothetical protein R3E13_07500 [Alphaproteobacteria bacterium]